MLFRTTSFSLLALLAALAVGCVGKGKYRALLLESAAANSALRVTERDLADSYAIRDQQAKRLLELNREVEALLLAKQRVASNSINSNQRLTNQLRAGDSTISQLNARLEMLEVELASYTVPLRNYNERLVEVHRRVAQALEGVPQQQVALERNPEAITLVLNNSLLFKSNKPDISEFGDALLSRLAAALGGQFDLDIAIRARGAVSEQKAFVRAQAVSSNLTEAHALLPSLVRVEAQPAAEELTSAPAEREPLAQAVHLTVKLVPSLHQRLPQPVTGS